ncbi:hypothetical protein LOK49_LG14G00012 [Camellia lanceoleosa]|uniref:Uncharacterized protein n=1 Tax=Camellia lanceoleosa TaxID=1840588 RepID=A0ACC0F931_9ERIC|nr:hypothetical protein LOK49_LG14G00012 [Camellia lanceoleosa]
MLKEKIDLALKEQIEFTLKEQIDFALKEQIDFALKKLINFAQQKMHCALQRNCNNTHKIVDQENNSTLRKSLEENNSRASANDCEVSSLAWRNSDHRYTIFTFFNPEPDGHWRIFALPLQCPDHTIHLGSGSQLKLDGLHLVSPLLVSSVSVDQQKARRGPTTERSCSVKSFTARSFSGSKFQYQSCNKGLANKVSRCNVLPGNSSCKTPFYSSDSSGMIPTGSNATNSSDIYLAKSKVDKAVKRNSKKKARKKGKQNKKLPCDTGSTDFECVHGSSTSETGVGKNTDYGFRPLQYATKLAMSSPEHSGLDNDSEGNGCGTINYSETPKACTSYIDEVNVLEANFIPSEHTSPNSENGVQTDTHSKPLSCFNDQRSSVFSETKDSPVLDSISVCSNGDESINAGYDAKLSTKDSGGINLSEASSDISKKGCFSHGNMLNGVEDSYCHTEGTTSCEQGCISGDMARKGKQIKRVPRNSSVSCLSTVGKFYGHSGKENNHSIWQKVQRNDTGECSYGLRKVNSANSQSGIGLKEVPFLRKNCNIAQSSILSTCEDKNQSKVKASRKLKRKPISGLKQELNYYSRKGPYATKASSNVCLKINMQQNEVLDIPAQFTGQKGLNGVSRSRFKIGSQKNGFQTNRVKSTTSKPIHNLEGRPNELEPLHHVCATLSSLNDQTAKRESSSLSGFCDHQDQTELPDGLSVEYHLPGVEEDIKIDKAVCSIEHSKQDHSCGSILQKWIPVGIKDSELARSGHSNSSRLANLNKSAMESCTLENTVREMAYDPNTFTSSINAHVMCSVQDSRDDNGLHSEDEVQIEKCSSQSTCAPKESCVNHAAAKCSSYDLIDQNNSSVENDSSKIAVVLNDAYRAQLASEAVQMATGCPIAEFERLLYSASPVISLPHNFLSCQTCLTDEVVGAPLCRHETPNISLGSLWQWYEKHGTYGLEVRAEDFENSKRLGIDRIAFRAYFVPFLSAVQLFRNCKSYLLDSSSRIPGTEACKLDRSSENSSNIGSLPIFSVLVPRLSLRTQALCHQGILCVVQTHLQYVLKAMQLFNWMILQALMIWSFLNILKLNNLSKGDRCLKFAWYPIYRIPDGSFRAAFLTYHSLGHLVRQSGTSDSFGVGACIVSPVVGLQSYNAQGECWFQLRQSAQCQTTEIPNLNPSGILKERLRTLEQTASLMARAVVSKGNLPSVNRQPDYEFFLSRRRWYFWYWEFIDNRNMVFCSSS